MDERAITKTVQVIVCGCDDETTFDMEVTILELEFLTRLAAKSKETSTYGCMPVIVIEESRS